MNSLEPLFYEVVREGEVKIALDNARDANNARQKLYYFRNKLRRAKNNPLTLLVDHFKFHLDGPVLIVKYDPPLWEKINDDAQSSTG